MAERWGCQIVAFVVTIIISRQLDPSVYGIVTITNAFLSVFAVFLEGGLGNALIQKKDSDQLDFSTVFYTNIVLCSFIYIIIYLVAPYVAKYYNEPQLASLLRVSGITILISALKNIQEAYVSKNMIFKKFFVSSLLGTIMAGVVGIVMAIKGFGAWAIVGSNLTDVIVDAIIAWMIIEWRPTLEYSFNRLRGLLDFGGKYFFVTLIDRIYNKTYHLSIGKYCSPADLAYYEKGYSISGKIADNTNTVVSSVLFPAMSNNQDDAQKLKEITKKSLQINIYVMTPVLMGIIAVSDPLIRVVLTEKWVMAIPYLRLFCLINLISPFEYINNNVIKSLGRSDMLLKQELINKSINIIILIICLQVGAIYVCIGRLIATLIDAIIKSVLANKLIGYSIVDQIKDTKESILMGTVMLVVVYAISFIDMNLLLMLIIQILVGIIAYLGLSILTKSESFYFVLDYINSFRKKKS